MLSDNVEFTSENIDFYLKELAKTFRKLNGKSIPAEIILIGGASILINYGFRNFTYDMDAVIQASSAIRDAIAQVSDKFQLPIDWINTDFKNTNSYSPKLIEVSKHYKTFSNIVEFRTVSAEYLIAMKLMSGRKYKHDLSDVIGIINEHNQLEQPISLSKIEDAFIMLYGDINRMPSYSAQMLKNIFENENLSDLFITVQKQEALFAQELTEFEKQYPNVLNDTNSNDILNILESKKHSKSTTLHISRNQLKQNADKLQSAETQKSNKSKQHSHDNNIE